MKHFAIFQFLLSTALMAGVLPSTVVLSSPAAQYTVGEPASLVATVTPSDATGTVEFLAGVNVIGRSAVVGGQALLATTKLQAGTQTVQARYTGNTIYAPASSPLTTVLIKSGAATGLDGLMTYETGSPEAIATGDLNCDGRTDIIVADYAGVNIYLGNGDGTFQTPVTYGPQMSTGVTVQDFDGDGIPDLAVGSANSTLSILHGNGDGTFEIGRSYATGNSPRTINVVDVNEDGLPDLVILFAQFGPSFGGVNLLVGNPDGSFQAATTLTGSPTVEAVGAMVTGDFDRNGTTDLILFRRDNSMIVLLRGNGDGTFQNEVTVGRIENVVTAIAVDLNGDGLLDLIAGDGAGGEGASPGAYNVHVFLGERNGVFADSVDYAVTGDFGEVVTDFDGDGKLDLATVSDDHVNVLQGNGDGTFQPATVYLLPDFETTTLAVGDFNSDGTVDLVAGTLSCCSNLNVLFGQKPAETSRFTDVPSSEYYFQAVSDLFTRGITNGCTWTQYCPGSVTLRWEAAILFVRSVVGTGNFLSSSIPYFADVPLGANGFAWIQKLYELGITSGCGANSSAQPLFCPNDPLTRAEAAVFTIRARFGSGTPFTFPAQPYFTDVPAEAFAFAQIQRLREENITSGCQTTLFCPNQAMPRGDLAVFLDRGEFNQQIALSTPVISEISPVTLQGGGAGEFYIAGRGTHFAQGTTQLLFGPNSGITASSITVNSPSYLTVTLSAQANAPNEPVTIYVQTGTEEAVLPNGLSVQP